MTLLLILALLMPSGCDHLPGLLAGPMEITIRGPHAGATVWASPPIVATVRSGPTFVLSPETPYTLDGTEPYIAVQGRPYYEVAFCPPGARPWWRVWQQVLPLVQT